MFGTKMRSGIRLSLSGPSPRYHNARARARKYYARPCAILHARAIHPSCAAPHGIPSPYRVTVPSRVQPRRDRDGTCSRLRDRDGPQEASSRGCRSPGEPLPGDLQPVTSDISRVRQAAAGIIKLFSIDGLLSVFLVPPKPPNVPCVSPPRLQSLLNRRIFQSPQRC